MKKPEKDFPPASHYKTNSRIIRRIIRFGLVVEYHPDYGPGRHWGTVREQMSPEDVGKGKQLQSVPYIICNDCYQIIIEVAQQE